MKKLLQFINKIINDKINNLSDILEIIYHNIETYKYLMINLYLEEIYEILKYICFISIIINIFLLKYITTKYNMFESIYSLLNYIIYNNILFYIIIFIIIIRLNQIIIKYKNIIYWVIYILKLNINFIKIILILILLFICIKFSLYTNNFSIVDLNILLSVNSFIFKGRPLIKKELIIYETDANNDIISVPEETTPISFKREFISYNYEDGALFKEFNPIYYGRLLLGEKFKKCSDLQILEYILKYFSDYKKEILGDYYYYLYNLFLESDFSEIDNVTNKLIELIKFRKLTNKLKFPKEMIDWVNTYESLINQEEIESQILDEIKRDIEIYVNNSNELIESTSILFILKKYKLTSFLVTLIFILLYLLITVDISIIYEIKLYIINMWVYIKYKLLFYKINNLDVFISNLHLHLKPLISDSYINLLDYSNEIIYSSLYLLLSKVNIFKSFWNKILNNNNKKHPEGIEIKVNNIKTENFIIESCTNNNPNTSMLEIEDLISDPYINNTLLYKEINHPYKIIEKNNSSSLSICEIFEDSLVNNQLFGNDPLNLLEDRNGLNSILEMNFSTRTPSINSTYSKIWFDTDSEDFTQGTPSIKSTYTQRWFDRDLSLEKLFKSFVNEEEHKTFIDMSLIIFTSRINIFKIINSIFNKIKPLIIRVFKLFLTYLTPHYFRWHITIRNFSYNNRRSWKRIWKHKNRNEKNKKTNEKKKMRSI
jgi:hypothetical protein